jgi:hypothetical protein
MGTETYPKSSQQPSKGVGLQETVSWDSEARGRTEYPGKSKPFLRMSTDKVKVSDVSTGKGSAPGNDYPKTKRSFETERQG